MRCILYLKFSQVLRAECFYVLGFHYALLVLLGKRHGQRAAVEQVVGRVLFALHLYVGLGGNVFGYEIFIGSPSLRKFKR